MGWLYSTSPTGFTEASKEVGTVIPTAPLRSFAAGPRRRVYGGNREIPTEPKNSFLRLGFWNALAVWPDPAISAFCLIQVLMDRI